MGTGGVKRVGKGWFYLHRLQNAPLQQAAAVLVCLFVLPAAARAYDTCIGNTTLRHYVNYTFSTDTATKNLTIHRDANCPYGCDSVTNTCAPNPTELNAYAIVAVVAIVIIGSVASKVLFHG